MTTITYARNNAYHFVLVADEWTAQWYICDGGEDFPILDDEESAGAYLDWIADYAVNFCGQYHETERYENESAEEFHDRLLEGGDEVLAQVSVY